MVQILASNENETTATEPQRRRGTAQLYSCSYAAAKGSSLITTQFNSNSKTANDVGAFYPARAGTALTDCFIFDSSSPTSRSGQRSRRIVRGMTASDKRDYGLVSPAGQRSARMPAQPV